MWKFLILILIINIVAIWFWFMIFIKVLFTTILIVIWLIGIAIYNAMDK